VFLLSSSCKNAAGVKEKQPETVVNTQHLKNISHSIDDDFLDSTTKGVKDFYKASEFKTVWTDEKDRKALHLSIQEAAQDGLLPADYNISALLEFENNIGITQEQCIEYDILLTQSFRKLANHLFKGKLVPYKVYYDWALPSKNLNSNKLLTQALAGHSVNETLAKCRPTHKTYLSLREGLAFLNSLPDDKGFKDITINGAVRLKDSGVVVKNIKDRLVFWKDLDPAYAKGSVYDRRTMKAVKHFQKRHGIYPDGVVSGSTLKALNLSLDKRKQQVIANLERWRWFAYDFGEKALVINIPEFQMAVMEENDTIEVYKVVVGKPERRTPVLHAVLSNLVINPTWTVPPTILKEDLTPSATEDRSYFASHNMKIYKHRDTVETFPEDWNPEKADHYRYVQGPGVNNSLGLVKFNFRNSFSVYLHDTNHRELFRKGYRALSSGCVRVQDPLKLAGYVLEKEEADWTKEKLDEMIAGGETKNVGLKKGTHVHQLYWTAWMDQGGLQFRNDVYNLDTILYRKLRQ
jgi:murein L,D-transpeptidase YcbB/YkuD